MYKMATVSKPAEPTCVWNAMQLTKLAGQYYHGSNFIGFEDHKAFDNPNNASRGPNNTAYDLIPSLLDLDPTSMLAQSKTAANFRNPVGSVGYTHHHRAMEYMGALGSQFMRWWREYNTLASLAIAAEKEQKSGVKRLLSDARTTHYGMGDIEAFLMATGKLTDGIISYPINDVVSVERIYKLVSEQLASVLSVLDNEGAKVGEMMAATSIGVGTIPKVGTPCAFLSAATIDALYRHPWKRAFTNPHVRDMFVAQIKSRIDHSNLNLTGNGKYIAIGEGSDVTYLPTMANTTELGTLTSLTDYLEKLYEKVDAKAVLSDTLYAHNRTNSWTDQFYTTGDLVEAIFIEDSVKPWLVGSRVCTMLAPPKTIDALNNPLFVGVTGTGALGSFNTVRASSDTVNYISGTTDYYYKGVSGVTALGGIAAISEGLTEPPLPNGILYLGDCASATALTWVKLLKWLDRSLTPEVRTMLDRTGRAKRSIPSYSTAKISSTDSLLAGMISSGSRDGYLTGLNASFNTDRKSRIENNGPVLGGILATAGGHFQHSPFLYSGGNKWDSDDSSAGLHVTDFLGRTYNITATWGMFTGHWESGRISRWQHEMISSSMALGTSDVAGAVGQSMMSIPLFTNDVRTASTSTVTKTHVYPSKTKGEAAYTITTAMLTDQTKIDRYFVNASTAVKTANGAASWEHFHPIHGFMRGLALVTPNTPVVNTASNEAGATNRGRSDNGHGASKIPLTGASPATKYYGESDDGSGFKDGDGAGAVMAPGNTWFWDPTRSQITGVSWHRWAGLAFTDVLPHPYCAEPFAVALSSVTLDEINTLGVLQPTERKNAAYLVSMMTRPAALEDSRRGFERGPYVPVHAYADNVTASGLLEDDYGSVNALGILGSPMFYKSMIVGDCAHLMKTIYDGSPSSGDVLDLASGSSGSSLNGSSLFDLNFGILNGCGLNHLNRATGIGLNATNAMSIGGLAYPSNKKGTSADFAGAIPFRLQGENAVPVGTNNGDIKMAVCVDGSGLIHEDDITTPAMLDCMQWLMSVFNGSSVYRHNYMMQDVVNAGLSAIGLVEAHQTQFIGKVDTATYGESSIGNVWGKGVPGSQTVENPWFSRNGTSAISNRRARDREDKLDHPWVRSEGQSGLVTLRYDVSDVDNYFERNKSALLSIGNTLNTGLTNSLFIELQTAN